MIGQALGAVCLILSVYLIWQYGDLYSLAVGIFIGGLLMLNYGPSPDFLDTPSPDDPSNPPGGTDGRPPDRMSDL